MYVYLHIYKVLLHFDNNDTIYDDVVMVKLIEGHDGWIDVNVVLTIICVFSRQC